MRKDTVHLLDIFFQDSGKDVLVAKFYAVACSPSQMPPSTDLDCHRYKDTNGGFSTLNDAADQIVAYHALKTAAFTPDRACYNFLFSVA